MIINYYINDHQAHPPPAPAPLPLHHLEFHLRCYQPEMTVMPRKGTQGKLCVREELLSWILFGQGLFR